MRSLMFDLRTLESFSKMPISALHFRGGTHAGEGLDALQVAGGGELHAFDGSLELQEVQRLELERVGEDELVLLDAVRAMNDVGRVQHEQRAVELGLAFSSGQIHDLHSEHQQWGRVMRDDGRAAVAAPD